MNADFRDIFNELPRGRRDVFHSAVMTTYTLNLDNFENRVLQRLAMSGVTSVSILADASCFEESIGITTAASNKLGRLYSVDTRAESGAFHPKMNFLIGDNSLL